MSPGVEFTLKCVYILLMNQKSVSKVGWDQIKQMIAVGFFDKLWEVNNNKNKLNKKILEALAKFIEKNNKFSEEEVKKASTAAYTLFVWLNALLDYSKTVEKIEPLERDVE